MGQNHNGELKKNQGKTLDLKEKSFICSKHHLMGDEDKDTA